MLRNTAGQTYRVYAFTIATGVPYTGGAATITATLKLDGASPGPTGDANPAEVGGGDYLFDLSQAETDAETIDIFPASATAGVKVIGVPGRVFTESSQAISVSSDPVYVSDT